VPGQVRSTGFAPRGGSSGGGDGKPAGRWRAWPDPHAGGARARNTSGHLQQVACGPARGGTCRAGQKPRRGVPCRVHGHVGNTGAQRADRGPGGHGAGGAAGGGVLNATANIILSKMADGTSYQDALAEAQRAGLAGRQIQRRVARVQVRRARRPVGQPPDDHRAEPGHHGPGMTPLRAGPRHPVRARSPAPAAARPRRGHP
jgi:hypothetical protein